MYMVKGEGCQSERSFFCITALKLYNNITSNLLGSVKVKLSLYGPSELQEAEAPRIYRPSAHEGAEVVSPSYRPPLPPGKISGTHFC